MIKTEKITFTCKLTTPELKARKTTVIAELKSLLRERVETEHGIKYRFDDTDNMIDLVTSFIKTERLCCDFFSFNLLVGRQDGNMARAFRAGRYKSVYSSGD